MTTPTERVRLRHGKGLSRCLTSQSLHGETVAYPIPGLESGQSQDDECPQIPGSSGQHWVLYVGYQRWTAVGAGLMQQLCDRVHTSLTRRCLRYSRVSCILRSITFPNGSDPL